MARSKSRKSPKRKQVGSKKRSAVKSHSRELQNGSRIRVKKHKRSLPLGGKGSRRLYKVRSAAGCRLHKKDQCIQDPSCGWRRRMGCVKAYHRSPIVSRLRAPQMYTSGLLAPIASMAAPSSALLGLPDYSNRLLGLPAPSESDLMAKLESSYYGRRHHHRGSRHHHRSLYGRRSGCGM